MKKRPTPFEKPSALSQRQHDTTDDLFSGLLRALVAEVITAAPWLALGFVLGAIVEAAGAMWRVL